MSFIFPSPYTTNYTLIYGYVNPFSKKFLKNFLTDPTASKTDPTAKIFAQGITACKSPPAERRDEVPTATISTQNYPTARCGRLPTAVEKKTRSGLFVLRGWVAHLSIQDKLGQHVKG